MKETRPEAMAKVFADEGGYSDDAHDPGGATKYGITIIDYRKYVKPGATKVDVKNMTKTEAQVIYDAHYLFPMMYDSLPAGVDYSVVDAAINSGVGRAPQWLKKALNTSSSGMPGLVAEARLEVDKQALIHRYWMIRLGFLKSLKTWQFFGKGWGNRIATGEALAVRLWLKWGLQAPPDVQKAELNKAAGNAKAKASNQGTVASGHIAGAGVTTGVAAKWAALSLIAKAAIIGIGVLFLLGLVYALYWTVQHNRRSSAFTKEMEAVR